MTNSKDRLHLSWDKFEAIDNGYPKFLLKSSFKGNCIKKTVLGEFTCLSGTIKLVRRVSYYVIRVYAPTFLSVIAAFIGFWIPILGWPARVIQFIKVLFSKSSSNDVSIFQNNSGDNIGNATIEFDNTRHRTQQRYKRVICGSDTLVDDVLSILCLYGSCRICNRYIMGSFY